MRSGKPLPTVGKGSTSNGSGAKISIHNYGGAKVEARQLSNGEIQVMIDERARQIVRTESPKIVAGELRNPNSSMAKSMKRNYNTDRKR